MNSAFVGGAATTISVGENTTLKFDKAVTLGGTITNAGTVAFSDNTNVTVDTSRMHNFEVRQAGTASYSDGDNGGFRINDTTQYYLVKGGNVSASGLTLGGTDVQLVTEGVTDGIVFTHTSSTPSGEYYILVNQSYDASKMGSATGFVVDKGKTFTATGGNLAGKDLVLEAGAKWQSNGATSFEAAQVQTLTLRGDANVSASGGSIGLIRSGFGATSLSLGGYTLSVNGNNHFALFNTAADAGTIQVNNGGYLQVGHSTRQSSADLRDVVVNIASGGHLTVDNNSTITVEGFTGAGTIQRDGGNGGTITIDANHGNYTFNGSITSTPNLVMSATSTGTQTLSLSGNTTLGTVAVNGGTLDLTSTVATGNLSVANGATLKFAGANQLTVGATSRWPAPWMSAALPIARGLP